jgi:peptidoglycan/xylan/chitin deacetylase (PgdA/CDA1 family)
MNLPATKEHIKDQLAQIWGPRSNPRVILTYHSVGSGSPYSLPATVFRRHVEQLRASFSIVPLSTMFSDLSVQHGPTAAITFDDGFEDVYRNAFPVLATYELPFSVFVCTGFIQGRTEAFGWSPHYAGLPSLKWSQVSEMRRAHCHIGSHTHSHPRLSNCSVRQIAAELSLSKSILQQQLGAEVTELAYPFGQLYDYSRRVRMCAREAGYSRAYTTIHRSLGPREDPFAIPRVTIDAAASETTFGHTVTGARDFMASFQTIYGFGVKAGVLRVPWAAPPPLGEV